MGIIAAMIMTAALLALCLRGGGCRDQFDCNFGGYEGRISLNSHGIQGSYFGNHGNRHFSVSHTSTPIAIWSCFWNEWPEYRTIPRIDLPWSLILGGPLSFGVVLTITVKLMDPPRGNILVSNNVPTSSATIPHKATLQYVSSGASERPWKTATIFHWFVLALALFFCCSGGLLFLLGSLDVATSIRQDPVFDALLVLVGGTLLGVAWLLRPSRSQILEAVRSP